MLQSFPSWLTDEQTIHEHLDLARWAEMRDDFRFLLSKSWFQDFENSEESEENNDEL